MSFCPHWSCMLCQAERQVYNLSVPWEVCSKVLPLCIPQEVTMYFRCPLSIHKEVHHYPNRTS